MDQYTAHSNALCIHCRIETWHVRASTSIRICITIKWLLKLPWVRRLSWLWVFWRRWIRITRTACRIHRWCWQSMYPWQPCRISTKTVTLLNCFSIQRQLIQCLHKKEHLSINLTIISNKLVNLLSFRYQFSILQHTYTYVWCLQENHNEKGMENLDMVSKKGLWISSN